MKLKKNSEHQEQVNLFKWAFLQSGKYPELELMHASLNGVKLNIGPAVKAKRGGMKRGVPDLLLPVARRKYHGLFIEMKIKPNRTTKEQEWWIDKLRRQGYGCAVCYGWEEAINVIIHYLEDK